MDVTELTRKLVRIPSVSGKEQGCVDLLREVLPKPFVAGRNIYAVRGDGQKTLLLNSHTDTVPASGRWNPIRCSISTDLPLPLIPTITTDSPGCTSSDSPFRTATPPNDL